MSWWEQWRKTLSEGWLQAQERVAELVRDRTLTPEVEAEADERLVELRKFWDRAEAFDQAAATLEADAAQLDQWLGLADQLRANVLDTLAVAELDPEQALGVTVSPEVIERAKAVRAPAATTTHDGDYGHPLLLAFAAWALWDLGRRYFNSWDAGTAFQADELEKRYQLNRAGQTLQDTTVPEESSVASWLLPAVLVAAGAAWAFSRSK